ncbi:MAG: PrsW family intramembrane metalloprotease [Actinomyces sp.]|nr:PrsW family intramembrane metalloprotease [Actinomyces sp.]
MSEQRVKWGGPGEDYRLARIGRVGGNQWADAPAGAPATGVPSPQEVAPVWSPPTRKRSIAWFEIIFTIVGVAALGFALFGYVRTGGLPSTVLTGVLALIPLGFIIAVLRFIDRWEPEPWVAMLVTFVWGAGAAAVVAMVINTALQTNIQLITGHSGLTMVATASIVAPIVEETLKGAGVVFVLAWRRYRINSLIDGIVYAGMAGAGFAFIENIQYFLRSSEEGQLMITWFLRGIMSPFLHPMATSFIGLAAAWGVVRHKSGLAWVWTLPLGWIVAVLIHGSWNYLASTSMERWFVFYLFVEVPIFIAWIVALLVMSARQARTIANGLEPYVRTGWILPGEVTMVVNRGARRSAVRWAAQGGRAAKRAMKNFQRLAAALGMDEMIHRKAGRHADRVAQDQDMLQQLIASRDVFLTRTRSAHANRQIGR